jgi:hypothetical protein
MRVALQGYRIIYSSELKFKHYITHQRLTESYRNALLQQANKPAEVMATYHRMLRWAYEPSWKKFIIAIVHLGKYMLFRLVGDRSKLSFSKDYLYFKTRWKIFQTGCNKAVWLYFNNLKDMSIEDERILKEI